VYFAVAVAVAVAEADADRRGKKNQEKYGSGDIGRSGPSGLRSPEPKHPSGRRVSLVAEFGGWNRGRGVGE
jgi:hypothetical protein